MTKGKFVPLRITWYAHFKSCLFSLMSPDVKEEDKWIIYKDLTRLAQRLDKDGHYRLQLGDEGEADE